MSYDIRLVDAAGETIELSEPHTLRGGTFASGGTTEAWLNITYNYARFYYDIWPEQGIRYLYGKTGADALPLLARAIAKLGCERSDNYWDDTSGNAGAALLDLAQLCSLCPDGVINGD